MSGRPGRAGRAGRGVPLNHRAKSGSSSSSDGYLLPSERNGVAYIGRGGRGVAHLVGYTQRPSSDSDDGQTNIKNRINPIEEMQNK